MKAWEEQEPRWTKLWDLWWSSPSHAGFGPDEHAVGLRAMCFANRFGRQLDGSGLVCLPGHQPMPLEVLARGIGCSTERVAKAVEMLVSVGTFIRRPDGFLVIPKLQKWQEDPSTARHRRAVPREPHRESGRESAREIHATTHASEVRGQRSEDQRSGSQKSEVRGQRGGEGGPPAPRANNILTFPAEGESSEWGLTADVVVELEAAFPSVDILAEARKALAWVQASPERRKTARGYRRFLTSWISRAKDNGRFVRRAPVDRDAEVLASVQAFIAGFDPPVGSARIESEVSDGE